MKLEGIHHITAITADAQENIDFYAGVLGLRLVKKTVNQDDPSVYHLFFADEKGSAGSDLTFFEFPGAPRGPRRRRHGPRRSPGGSPPSEALDFWEERLAARDVETQARRGHARLRRPRGPPARAARLAPSTTPPLIADHPEVPRELALRGFDGVRAFSSQPGARASGCCGELGFEAASDRFSEHAWEARGEQPRRHDRLRPAARRARPAGRRHRPPRRLGLDARGARGVARARDRRRRPPDAGDRPLLLPVDLLPRAERRAVRDRHARPGLHGRRAARVARREALAAARLRAPPRSGRGEPEAGSQPAAGGGMSGRPRLARRRPAAPRAATASPSGALILNHGRGADENDLFGAARRARPRAPAARRDHRSALARDPARRPPLVRRRAGRLPARARRSRAATRRSAKRLDGLLAERGIPTGRSAVDRRLLPGHRHVLRARPRRRPPGSGRRSSRISGFIPEVEGWERRPRRGSRRPSTSTTAPTTR